VFDKTIAKIVDSKLPALVQGFESKYASVLKAQEELLESYKARITTLEEQLAAERAGINMLSKLVSSHEEVIETLPESDDIVTADTLGNYLQDVDIFADFNPNDHDILTRDNFDAGDFDLVVASDMPCSDDIVTTESLEGSVMELLEDMEFLKTVFKRVLRTFMEDVEAPKT
jgi:uncharacterized coiled-coil protein SlyX